jgi:hypothetical protein
MHHDPACPARAAAQTYQSSLEARTQKARGGNARHGASRRIALGVLRKERLVAIFENTVMIARPIQDVFAFLSEP